jgi:hypothetical protein
LPQSVLTKVVRPGRMWLVDVVGGRLLLRELTSAGSTAYHDAELDTLLDILLAPNLWLCQWPPLDTSETATLSWERTYVGRHDVLRVEDSAATSGQQGATMNECGEGDVVFGWKKQLLSRLLLVQVWGRCSQGETLPARAKIHGRIPAKIMGHNIYCIDRTSFYYC